MIEIKDVKKSFDGRLVLNGVNLVIHDGETLVISNRDTIAKLYRKAYFMELIVRYCRAQMEKAEIEVFPWLEALDEDEKKQFDEELMSCMKSCLANDDWSAVNDLLEDWQATSEVIRSPHLVKVLTNDAKRTYVPVADDEV